MAGQGLFQDLGRTGTAEWRWNGGTKCWSDLGENNAYILCLSTQILYINNYKWF